MSTSINLGESTVFDAIAATSSATAAPTAATDPFFSRTFSRVRTLVAYSGTVTSCALTIWIRDPLLDVWYEGASTDALDPLSPGGASAVNEARDWDVGFGQYFTFQISAIAGGGSAAVRVVRVSMP